MQTFYKLQWRFHTNPRLRIVQEKAVSLYLVLNLKTKYCILLVNFISLSKFIDAQIEFPFQKTFTCCVRIGEWDQWSNVLESTRTGHTHLNNYGKIKINLNWQLNLLSIPTAFIHSDVFPSQNLAKESALHLQKVKITNREKELARGYSLFCSVTFVQLLSIIINNIRWNDRSRKGITTPTWSRKYKGGGVHIRLFMLLLMKMCSQSYTMKWNIKEIIKF